MTTAALIEKLYETIELVKSTDSVDKDAAIAARDELLSMAMELIEILSSDIQQAKALLHPDPRHVKEFQQARMACQLQQAISRLNQT